jgi:N,N'-diacetylchitobiose non-reducing end deacetylase
MAATPAIPDLWAARRILCVQPHYDDNDIGGGGTLARLHDQGTEIIYLTVTDDLVGVVDPYLADEQAARQLKQEQRQAGAIIGVARHEWLGYPDAGDYNYFEMRRRVIAAIRRLRPDFLMTCDPWLPYEAHRDHVQTGLAVAEASYLHAMPRLKSDPEADRDYQPYPIQGVIFYFSHAPNAIVDIDAVYARKQQALACYQAQFASEDMERLLRSVEAEQRRVAQGEGYTHGEAFKVVRPDQLHIDTRTWQV